MKDTDTEDLHWFDEFAKSCEGGPMNGEELLGRALVFALTGRGDVQSIFDDRRSEHPAFWDRFERFTGLRCDHDGDGWCFFSCSC